jgi:hypothetical protein
MDAAPIVPVEIVGNCMVQPVLNDGEAATCGCACSPSNRAESMEQISLLPYSMMMDVCSNPSTCVGRSLIKVPGCQGTVGAPAGAGRAPVVLAFG